MMSPAARQRMVEHLVRNRIARAERAERFTDEELDRIIQEALAHVRREGLYERITVGQLRVGDVFVRDGRAVERIEKLHPQPARRIHFTDGRCEVFANNQLFRIARPTPGASGQLTL